MKSPIVLAAGGTGGHVFPAESVALVLARKGYKVVFVTDKAGRRFDRLPSTVQVMVLPMHRRGNSIVGMIKFGWGILRSLYHVYRGFKRMKPAVVVGFGGYPSFPAVAVAQGINIPSVIHEQNAVLGQVNRILSKKAKCLALSFEHTERVDTTAMVKVVGTPVRDAFYAFRETKYAKLNPEDPMHILVTGGSQGARVFSTIVPKAIAGLSEDVRQRMTVLHQCPKDDVESLKKTYEELNINAEVVGFIENMAEEICKAHLVIARSGASTLAELAVVGRPAILVPFPGAKDDHQWVNAKHIQAADAGWCVRQAEFTEAYLTEKIESLIQEPKLLYDAALRMKDLGCITAAEEIVNLIETHLKKEV